MEFTGLPEEHPDVSYKAPVFLKCFIAVINTLPRRRGGWLDSETVCKDFRGIKELPSGPELIRKMFIYMRLMYEVAERYRFNLV